jgi:hypothetical protein
MGIRIHPLSTLARRNTRSKRDEEREREAVEKADEVMRDLFTDENLGLVRELLEEWFRKGGKTGSKQ